MARLEISDLHVSVVTENIPTFISATIIGTLLATVFRWWAMRKFVFPHPTTPPELEQNEAASPLQA